MYCKHILSQNNLNIRVVAFIDVQDEHSIYCLLSLFTLHSLPANKLFDFFLICWAYANSKSRSNLVMSRQTVSELNTITHSYLEMILFNAYFISICLYLCYTFWNWSYIKTVIQNPTDKNKLNPVGGRYLGLVDTP